jgi:hypothetical protein
MSRMIGSLATALGSFGAMMAIVAVVSLATAQPVEAGWTPVACLNSNCLSCTGCGASCFCSWGPFACGCL